MFYEYLLFVSVIYELVVVRYTCLVAIHLIAIYIFLLIYFFLLGVKHYHYKILNLSVFYFVKYLEYLFVDSKKRCIADKYNLTYVKQTAYG